MQGDLRELFIHDLLIPLLPANFGVGRGKVISSYRQTSHQIDCLVYDKNILPPMLISGGVGVFSIESTLMTVEVKTKLTAEELKTSHLSAAEIEKFIHACPLEGDQHSPGHRIEHVIPCVFAYGSDLTSSGKSEIIRYDEIRGLEQPTIRLICVVGRGFWFWQETEWISWDFGFEHGEVCGFMAAIVNSCQRISQTRRRPDFRAYLGWNLRTSPKIANLVQG